ncbi:hypothetical protein K502DRAFT_355192 [Neoconidiobolus thromboides FSU 785]|nr:hypothetical protein K502DRAFT_355192 [Neoconidiobolus thromboides FSU 785]
MSNSSRRKSLFIKDIKVEDIHYLNKNKGARPKSTIGLPLEKQRFDFIKKINEEEDDDFDDSLSLLDMLKEESPVNTTTHNQSVTSLASEITLSSVSSRSNFGDKSGINLWPRAFSFRFSKKKRDVDFCEKTTSRRNSIESALELEIGKLKIKENNNFDEVLLNGFLNEKESKPTLRITLTPKIAKDDVRLKDFKKKSSRFTIH